MSPAPAGEQCEPDHLGAFQQSLELREASSQKRDPQRMSWADPGEQSLAPAQRNGPVASHRPHLG